MKRKTLKKALSVTIEQISSFNSAYLSWPILIHACLDFVGYLI